MFVRNSNLSAVNICVLIYSNTIAPQEEKA